MKCKNCNKVRKHSDGLLFCSIYSFRVVGDFAKPSYCKRSGRRNGEVPMASKKIPDKAILIDRATIYKEPGGRA